MIRATQKAFRIWWKMATAHFAIVAVSRLDFYTFFTSKLIRMFFFFFFIIALFSHTPTLAGYTKGEALLFFALMNAIDVLAQLLWFRGLTDVQRLVRGGEFDFVLTKPVSPVLYSSFRIFDVFDFSTIPAALFFLVYAFQAIGPLPFDQVVTGIYLCGLGLILAYSIVLFLSSFNFWTTEIHNAFWIYRESFYMAQYPPEVFPSGIQVTFTYLVPLFIIIAFPTKAFLGILDFNDIVLATLITLVCYCIARCMWCIGLRQYTSASS